LIFEYKFDLKSCPIPVQDKVQYRRKRILELKSKRFSNVQIAHELQYNISTIERDLVILRNVTLPELGIPYKLEELC